MLSPQPGQATVKGKLAGGLVSRTCKKISPKIAESLGLTARRPVDPGPVKTILPRQTPSLKGPIFAGDTMPVEARRRASPLKAVKARPLASAAKTSTAKASPEWGLPLSGAK